MSDLFYLHEYTGGQADMSRSCGFVKFSCQNGWMVNKSVRILINLKGVYSHGTAIENVYALIRMEDGGFAAVKLSDIYIENGFGKAECVVNAEDISQSGFSWEEAAGIAVIQGDSSVVTAALWKNANDDLSGIRYNITKNDSYGETDDDAAINYTDEAADAAVDAAENETVNTAENEMNDISSVVTENNNVKETQIIPAGETINAEEISIIPIQRKAPEIQQIFDKVDGNSVDAFDDDYFYDCMEVTPNQLQQIIGTNVSENSFLMHGYYTFRHILIAKVQSDPNVLFVGVPGIYNNRERFMASMFNFNNFKRSHRSDCRNPHFGYWYQEM